LSTFPGEIFLKNVIECLRERGFVEAVTSEELVEAAERPLKVYCGFDPTADSLHLGNLVGIVGLAWFHRFGHKAYVILGGATARIGDPSGKSIERPLLAEEDLQHNVRQLRKFFEGLFPAVILDNNEWYSKFSLIDYMREVGRHFRVGQMIAKESVKARLASEEGISFTEFSYQTLQGYDFHVLNRDHGVTVEIGGSDQWGNITAGTELNRKLKGPQLFGLTFPLLTRSDGKKFGKSEEGAIWLSADKLTPYQFFQYLFRIPDADVIRLLKMLTFLDLAEIEKIEKQMKEAFYVPNSAQLLLATEVTRFVHGDKGVEAALRVTQGMGPGSDAVLNAEVLAELAKDMPNAELSRAEVVGQKYVDLLVKTELLPSKGEAVRLIKNGGAYLNNERVSDSNLIIADSHLIETKYLILSAGKKKRLLLKCV
jgi:tyrosyl-tRNA synthetase